MDNESSWTTCSTCNRVVLKLHVDSLGNCCLHNEESGRAAPLTPASTINEVTDPVELERAWEDLGRPVDGPEVQEQ